MVVYIIYISLYFFRFPKQSQFNPHLENVEYDNLLIMPANGRRDLIRRLKVNVKGRVLQVPGVGRHVPGNVSWRLDDDDDDNRNNNNNSSLINTTTCYIFKNIKISLRSTVPNTSIM